jgi:hypothetical protein
MEIIHGKNKTEIEKRRQQNKELLDLQARLEMKYEDALKERFQTEKFTQIPVYYSVKEQGALDIETRKKTLKELEKLLSQLLIDEEVPIVINSLYHLDTRIISSIVDQWYKIDQECKKIGGVHIRKAGGAQFIVMPVIRKFIESLPTTYTPIPYTPIPPTPTPPTPTPPPTDTGTETEYTQEDRDKAINTFKTNAKDIFPTTTMASRASNSISKNADTYMIVAINNHWTKLASKFNSFNISLNKYKEFIKFMDSFIGLYEKMEKPINNNSVNARIDEMKKDPSSTATEETEERVDVPSIPEDVPIVEERKTITPSDNTTEPNSFEKEFGEGFTILKKKVKLGKGIQQKKEPDYIEFGSYIIHIPSLHKRLLNIKTRKSVSQIKNLPKQVISRSLTDFLFDVMEKKQVNQSLFKTLSNDDQILFRRISTQSKAGLGMEEYHGSDDDVDRFELLKGSVLAGNNSPESLRELKYYVLKFIGDGRISNREGNKLLAEISILI